MQTESTHVSDHISFEELASYFVLGGLHVVTKHIWKPDSPYSTLTTSLPSRGLGRSPRGLVEVQNSSELLKLDESFAFVPINRNYYHFFNRKFSWNYYLQERKFLGKNMDSPRQHS